MSLLEEYNFNVSIDGQYITVVWERLPMAAGILDSVRYPKLQMSFKYDDISSDTVQAMLRDMGVPDPQSKAVMTYITANTT